MEIQFQGIQIHIQFNLLTHELRWRNKCRKKERDGKSVFALRRWINGRPLLMRIVGILSTPGQNI